MNGKTAVLDDYTKLILAGFEQAYRFMQDKADVLLVRWTVSLMFAHNARFIYRPTALYALILRRALHPAYVRDVSISACSPKSSHAQLLACTE